MALSTQLASLGTIFGPIDPAAESTVECHIEAHSVTRDVATVSRFRSPPFCYCSASLRVPDQKSMSVKVLIVEHGNVRFDQWKTSFVAGPGDILVIMNWIPFQLNASEQFGALLFDVPAWWAARELLPDTHGEHRVLISADLFSADSIGRLATRIYDMEGKPTHHTEAMLMFGGLIRRSLPLSGNIAMVIPAMAGRVGRILTFICQQIDNEDVTPQDAAQALRCSVRTIHKTCADAGTSFNNLQIEVRLSFAAHRLATTAERVSEVAYAAGFVSLSHFCRLFKTRFGVSAGGYRRKYML